MQSIYRWILPDLEQCLNLQGYQTQNLQARAENHSEYLQRPDFGCLLSASASDHLQYAAQLPVDAVVVVADGLSSNAIEQHAEPFLSLLLPELQTYGYKLSPACLGKYGRVAIDDVMAERYVARLYIVLIGGHPSLRPPGSMGVYFTYQVRWVLSTDADRNCIFNIQYS